MMGYVVSKEQSTFIKGRNILDGLIIVNVFISWSKKRNKRTLILKVDFEKAFDSLNRGYLDDIMNQMGFGDKWRSWVRGCLWTAKVSVLVNESNGLRGQGDPIVPFLFILAAEGLEIAMEEAP